MSHPQYLPLQAAYLAAFGLAPTQQTLLNKRSKGLQMVLISNKWLTTVEAVMQFEQHICESKMTKPLAASIAKTSTPAAKAKRQAVAAAALDAAGI